MMLLSRLATLGHMAGHEIFVTKVAFVGQTSEPQPLHAPGSKAATGLLLIRLGCTHKRILRA